MDGSVFNSLFLERIDYTDLADPLAESGVIEAETAGPWSVRKTHDGQWEVVAEGRGPVAVVAGYETALLVAAALPALGRRFFTSASDESPDALGHELRDASGEFIARYSSMEPETFVAHLNILEYLRRSPLDLARLMYAAKGPALQRAGAILFIWEQAGR